MGVDDRLHVGVARPVERFDCLRPQIAGQGASRSEVEENESFLEVI